MNGHVDELDLTCSGMRTLEPLPPMVYHWKKVPDLPEWATDLATGELLSIPNFSLYDAMSAIELMDPKMDIGLLLKNRKVRYDVMVFYGWLLDWQAVDLAVALINRAVDWLFDYDLTDWAHYEWLDWSIS